VEAGRLRRPNPAPRAGTQRRVCGLCATVGSRAGDDAGLRGVWVQDEWCVYSEFFSDGFVGRVCDAVEFVLLASWVSG
jgi:hypothetical protein